jgi:hypothetical protein
MPPLREEYKISCKRDLGDIMVTFKKTTVIKTPMLDKMLEVHDKSQILGEFIEWLNSREPQLFLCEVDVDAEQFYPTYPNIEKLLAEFFNIDLNQAEKERNELLAYARSQNDKEKTRKTDQ